LDGIVDGTTRTARRRAEPRPYPLWLRLAVTGFVATLVPVYWHHYGPGNFLWFSDIALFAVFATLWTGRRLPYSMMAVGVLPLEIFWTLDFLTGGGLGGLAGYMFEAERPLYLRALSLFHLFLPPIIVWMLIRDGYDRRALRAQTLLACVVLPLSWWVTDPADNINWVHGLGPGVEVPVAPLVYLGAYLVLLPVIVFLPTHYLLRRLFAR